MEARERLYRGRQLPFAVANRVVILVDDGLATAMTAAAAISSLRRQGPARIVFAVPVGSPQAIRNIAQLADEVVCLYEPADLRAVGPSLRGFRGNLGRRGAILPGAFAPSGARGVTLTEERRAKCRTV